MPRPWRSTPSWTAKPAPSYSPPPEAAGEDLRGQDSRQDTRDRFSPSMADALVALAENQLAARDIASVRSLAGPERAAIVVHVDGTLAHTPTQRRTSTTHRRRVFNSWSLQTLEFKDSSQHP